MKLINNNKKTYRPLITSLMMTSALISAPAIAQSADEDSKVAELSNRLDQAMALIQQLSSEIKLLKSAKAENSNSDDLETVQVVQRQMSEVTERLDEIEGVVVDVEDRIGSRAVANVFDAERLDIGGFLLSTLTHVNGEDGSTTSFNRQVFELLINGKLSDDFTFFVAQAFTREASPIFTDPAGRRSPDFNLGTGSPTPIAWANYRLNDAFNVRVGKWVAPHGIINIEHFPAILLDTEQPQFLRPFGGQTIFANFQTGVQVHGRQFLGASGENELNYAFYVGNFGGNQDNFNVGGRVGYTFGQSGVTVGLNGAFGRRAEVGDSEYRLFGADLLYDKGPILWKTEFFKTDEDLGEDRLAFYSQPAWRINDKWTAFYRYDYLDDGTIRGDRREHAFGLAFNPIPNVRIRSTATFRHFDSGIGGFGEADAQLYQLSSTYSF
ncbi:OprO/OprP family phosphate-selective porin [Kordiimonas aquimaris]|uniref:OprO/OprP family phosphate-selective porin n=1 Tax=Kordiimonas aquimaris TaxID=707591 RepID=UPI0021CDEFE2|nr:OprO/OprP family phosphate-selective porin [Kordiimonas aquimaris]